MAVRTVEIPEIGEVQLIKHPRAKSLRISIGSNAVVKVSIPSWMPYKAGIVFVNAKKDWILEHRPTVNVLVSKMAIGKTHHLYFQADPDRTDVTSRKKGSELWVTYPSGQHVADDAVRQAAKKIAIRALRQEAENLLPFRIKTLATEHDFTYKSVSVRQLKARWGSCNSKQEITLNLFLMQLPWNLIDYVLLHELTHTKALHHGAEFWRIFNEALPGAKQLRKSLHTYKPDF